MDRLPDSSQPEEEPWDYSPNRKSSSLSTFPTPSLRPPSFTTTPIGSRQPSPSSSFEVVPTPSVSNEDLNMNDADPEEASSESPPARTVAPNQMSAGQKPKKVIRTVGPFPAPGTVGAPSFTGHNVTSFLSNFELACKNHYIAIEERVAMLPYYCDPLRKVEVETLPEVVGGDWPGMVKAMKKMYKTADAHQTMMTLAYLEKISEYKDKATHDELSRFANEFRAISKVLLDRQIISTPVRCRLFLQRLPERMRYSICKGADIDAEDPETLDWDDIFRRTEKEIRAMRNYEALKEKGPASQEIARLVEDMALERAGAKGLSLNVPVVQTGKSDNTITQKGDKPKTDQQMDDLVEKFGALTLPVMTSLAESQKAMADAYVRMIRTGQPSPIPNYPQPQYSGRLGSVAPSLPAYGAANNGGLAATSVSASRALPAGPDACFHCRELGHRRLECPVLLKQMSEGKCYLAGGRTQMGSEINPLQHLRIFVNRNGPSIAEDVETLWAHYQSENIAVTAAPASSTALVKMIQVYEPEEEEEEADYPDLSAYSLQTDPRKADTVRKAHKERQYPTVKNPPIAPKTSSSFPARDSMDLDTEVPSKPSSTWQNGNREKLEQALKERGNSVQLINKIMDMPVSLPLGDILSNSGELRSALFRGVPKGGQGGSFHVRSAALGDEGDRVRATMQRIRDVRSYGCPYLRVRVNGEPVDALWDTGAEVSVVSEKWADTLQLPISRNVKINMKGIGGSNEDVTGCAENVPIQFGHLEYPTSLFVVRGMDPDTFVLGRPLQRATRARMSDAKTENRHPIFEFISTDGKEKVSMAGSSRHADREFTRRDCYQSSSLKC